MIILNGPELVQMIHHEWAVPCGWWTDLETGQPKDRDIDELVTLVVTELAEAAEGIRKDLKDDKLPQYPMESVEIADAIIRMYDLAGGMGIEVHECADNHSFDKTRTKLANLKELIEIVTSNNQYTNGGVWFHTCISKMLSYCADYDIDNIEQIIYDKMEFNRHRADHKLENRKKEGGKKS